MPELFHAETTTLPYIFKQPQLEQFHNLMATNSQPARKQMGALMISLMTAVQSDVEADLVMTFADSCLLSLPRNDPWMLNMSSYRLHSFSVELCVTVTLAVLMLPVTKLHLQATYVNRFSVCSSGKMQPIVDLY
jgi:hypothetical protein